MKKILQVVSCLDTGGTESFLMNMYRFIDRTKFQFDFLVLVTSESPYVDEINKLGGRVIFANAKPSIFHPFVFKKNVLNIIKEYGPYDVIHSHINTANALVLWVGNYAGIPIRISHSHSIRYMGINPLKNAIIYGKRCLINKYATQRFACSVEAGIDLYGRNKRFYVINNGIDVEKFNRPYDVSTLKEEFDIEGDNVIYCNISRYDYSKNFLFALDVFNAIRQKQKNAILILGGQDGPAYDDVVGRIKALGLEGCVRLTGRRTDIPAILQLTDIFIFPSKYEGLGIALLECQSAGTPSFTSTEVPSFVDVGLGLVQFVSLSESAEEWATKILDYKKPTISEQEIFEKFSCSGYNVKTSVKQLERLYEQKGPLS